MRILRHPRIIVLSAVVGAVLTTEFTASGVRSFWTRHPVSAGLVSGLLLLGIALWIVEGLVAERTKPIARQAYRALGLEMTGLQNLMRWAINGRTRTPAGMGVDSDCWKAVQQTLNRLDQLPSGRWQRLPVLLGNRSWREAARDLLRAERRQLHETVSGWAPVMLLSPALTNDLARISVLTEDIGRLGHALTTDGDSSSITSMWRSVVDEAAKLEADFYRAARSSQYDARYTEKYTPEKLDRSNMVASDTARNSHSEGVAP